ncbi:glycosyltransferase family 4 protein [Acidisoma sp.]|uniref:glycosyltransferase family 4 protein n=1 Tax=Acidisoma sp. TaxID=1872115 RepID=UPI003AFFCBE2
MTRHAGPSRVFLSTDAVGGVWQYTLELARAFARRRVEVDIAVLGPGVSADQRRRVADLHGVRLHETGLPLDWTANAPSELDIASNTLAALAQQLNADTVQLHTPALVAQSLWHAPVLAVIHSCVGTWWSAMRGGADIPDDFVWRMAAVRTGLRAASCVVAPTRAFAEMVGRTYDLQRKIDVVHNGRAAAKFSLKDRTEREGVLAVGRLWDEAKNMTLLDDAAKLMTAVPVAAAGANQGPNGATVRLGRMQALGILDEPKIAEAMAAARIFASPAQYEPFGLAVLEAAHASLPLVLADIPTFRELWDGAAIFLPLGDAAVWAETLSDLHGQPESCRRWGMKARARATTYSVERFDGAMWEKHSRMLDPAARAAVAA